MNILIVDDQESLRELAAHYVSDAGHIPVMAASGEEALEALSVIAIDMVFLDVKMEGLDGFETCTQMREVLGDRWIPIIFLSGNTETKHYEKGICVGADDYLLKPVSPVILKAKINAMQRIVDINAKLEEAYDELERQSLVDSLTEVTTRKGFFTHSELCLKNTQRQHDPLSIIMLDVDHFKQFNDNYGHVRGDEVLRSVAGALSSKVKRPLDMIARYGGEEFVAILPNTEYEGAKKIAEEMRKAVSDLNISHDFAGDKSIVTVSMGMCYCPNTSQFSLEDLISTADKALYSSKDNGRNIVSYLQLDPPS